MILRDSELLTFYNFACGTSSLTFNMRPMIQNMSFQHSPSFSPFFHYIEVSLRFIFLHVRYRGIIIE